MLKTLNLSRNSAREARLDVEFDTMLREMERGLKRMKKLDAEIAALRVKTRASLARLKAS